MFLKTTNLYPTYRFLSKINVNDFLNRNNILEKHQCGFRRNQSLKTALLKILNIRWNLDLDSVGSTGSKHHFWYSRPGVSKVF